MSQNRPMALFTSENGKIRPQLKLVDQTLWLTQKLLAPCIKRQGFEKTLPTINEHLKNIYDEGELQPEATIRKFRIVAREGVTSVSRLVVR